MTFWAFGDSFMAYDANYIRTLANSCNADNVQTLGVNGTGLLFTYQMLLQYRDKIQDDDVVLIGLSSTPRHMFDHDWHVTFGGLDRRLAVSDDQYKAGKMYFKHLYNDTHAGNLAHAILSSIFHSIIPSIKSQRVSAIITTDIDGYTDRYNIPDYLFTDDTLFNIVKSYLIHKRDFDSNDIDTIMKQLNGKNHWLTYDDYSKYFFSKIHRVLDDLQIHKVTNFI